MDFSQEVPTARVNHITRKFMDIPYGIHGKQRLDIYLPEEGDGHNLFLWGTSAGEYYSVHGWCYLRYWRNR